MRVKTVIVSNIRQKKRCTLINKKINYFSYMLKSLREENRGPEPG